MDHLERRTDAYILDRTQIENLLRSIHQPNDLQSFERIPSGKSNTNYLLRFNGVVKPLVLRLYVRDPMACALEWQLYHMLRNAIPMPEIRYASMGNTPQGLPPFSILSYVEGIPLGDYLSGAHGNPEPLAYEIGAVLANISKYKFHQAGFFNADIQFIHPFTDVIDGYLTYLAQTLFHGVAGEKLGEERARRIWKLYEENTPLLDTIRESAELVHADFGLWNILVKVDNGEAHLSAVLDWEFAHSGTCLLDVGHMLRYRRLLPDRFEERFLEGFTSSGGQLPEGWRRISSLLDLMCLCDMLNTAKSQPAWDREMEDLICATLRDWEDGALS